LIEVMSHDTVSVPVPLPVPLPLPLEPVLPLVELHAVCPPRVAAAASTATVTHPTPIKRLIMLWTVQGWRDGDNDGEQLPGRTLRPRRAAFTMGRDACQSVGG